MGRYLRTSDGCSPDYAKLIKEQTIILPKKNPTPPRLQDKKEQKVIKLLLDSIKINIQTSSLQEVDARLSSLLQRIEKLGLSLEGYLGSISKPLKIKGRV